MRHYNKNNVTDRFSVFLLIEIKPGQRNYRFLFHEAIGSHIDVASADPNGMYFTIKQDISDASIYASSQTFAFVQPAIFQLIAKGHAYDQKVGSLYKRLNIVMALGVVFGICMVVSIFILGLVLHRADKERKDMRLENMEKKEVAIQTQ